MIKSLFTRLIIKYILLFINIVVTCFLDLPRRLYFISKTFGHFLAYAIDVWSELHTVTREFSSKGHFDPGNLI